MKPMSTSRKRGIQKVEKHYLNSHFASLRKGARTMRFRFLALEAVIICGLFSSSAWAQQQVWRGNEGVNGEWSFEWTLNQTDLYGKVWSGTVREWLENGGGPDVTAGITVHLNGETLSATKFGMSDGNDCRYEGWNYAKPLDRRWWPIFSAQWDYRYFAGRMCFSNSQRIEFELCRPIGNFEASFPVEHECRGP
jgi:hypothetical protein